MLGKLLKHEFRATVRIMLPLILALLTVSVMANFSFRYLDTSNQSAFLNTISIIVAVLFVVGIIAVGVVSVVLMIQRFRSNLLQDEGYIMFTLPASVHSIIWSKIIVSAVWFLVTFAVIFASCGISIMRVSYISEFFDIVKELFEHLSAKYALNSAAMILEIFLLVFLGCTAVCVTFYAALATGHGFANHKMLLSVVAFFAFTIGTELIIGLLDSGFTALNLSLPFYNSVHTFMGAWHLGCAYSALGIFLYGAVFYAVTAFSLKRRLNLE